MAVLAVILTTFLHVTTQAAVIAPGYTVADWPHAHIGTGGDAQNLASGSSFHERTVPDFPSGVAWTTAIGLYCPDGAQFGTSSGERAQLSGDHSGNPAWDFTEGEVVWIDFWNCISSPHPTGLGWVIHDQVHLNAGGTQAVLQHDYRDDEQVSVTEGGGWDPSSVTGSPYNTPLVPDTWVRHTYHVKWSKTATGFLNYYRNGVLINQRSNWRSLGTVAGTTLTYPLIGPYRNTAYTAPHVVFYGGYAIHDSNPLPTGPAVPAGLTATAVSGTQVNLAWQNVANETGFEIQRKTTNGSYGSAHTTAVNVTSWNDTGRAPGNYYTYQVRALGAGGNSAWSTAASAGTPVTYDFNALAIAASSGDGAVAVTYAGASNGNFLRYDSDAVGDYVTFNVSVPNALTYQVKVKHNRNDWRGIVQLAVNGVNLGATQNGHSETQNFLEFTVGATAIAAGTRTFKFTVTGKSSGSQDYQMGLDLLTLTPTGL